MASVVLVVTGDHLKRKTSEPTRTRFRSEWLKSRLTRDMIACSVGHYDNILPFMGYFLRWNFKTVYLVCVWSGNVKDYLASKAAKPEERLPYEILSKGSSIDIPKIRQLITEA